jgi:RimJ/RimL family protein N-acetyltransferase
MPANVIACDLHFPALSSVHALCMMRWRYAPPYSAYDLNPEDPSILAALLDPANNYHAILRRDQMIGFFCLGPDARVPGGTYDESHLDLGLGLRPDLTGCGHGHIYLNAVLHFISAQMPSSRLRSTVAAWNQRAIRLCQRASFRVSERFITQHGVSQQEYVVLVKPGGG